MKNRLIKQISRTYLPGSPGLPADPGQPYLPPRKVRVTVEECGWEFDYVWYQVVPVYNADYSDISFYTTVPVPMYAYRCRLVDRLVDFPAQPYRPPSPAVPASPAQIVTDYNLGWSARARSIREIREFGSCRFKVSRSSAGAVVGLAASTAASGYADILHAFYVANGRYRVIEAGALVTGWENMPGGAVFRILRSAGQILYYVDDVLARSAADTTEGNLHLTAVLYAGGDEVFDPVLLSPDSANGVAVRAFARAGNDTDYGFAQAARRYATGRVDGLNEGAAVAAPRLAFGGEYAYGFGQAQALPRRTSGDAGDDDILAPDFNAGMAVATFRRAHGSGYLRGRASGGAVARPRIAWGADTPYCFGEGRALARQTWGSVVTPAEMLDMTMISTSVALNTIDINAAYGLVLVSGAAVESVLAYQLVVPAQVVSDATVTASMVLEALLEMVLLSSASPLSEIDASAPEMAVWVSNATTGAVSRYEGWRFNSFAKIGDAYYGCGSDGLYRLDGDTDNGEPVRAMLSFGKQDFGTSLQKRVPYAYMGVSSSGRVFLKVLADGEQYLYASRNTTENLQTQRVDLGRGLQASFIEFEIYNEDGADFELSSVEFVAVALSRRI